MGDYKKLVVWQRANELTKRVNRVVAYLPTWELDLRDQLKRAARSIRSNIVEGNGFDSDAQFARHLGYSLSSANETQDHLEEARDSGYLRREDMELITHVEQLRGKIASFRRTLTGQQRAKKKPILRKKTADDR